ncbi:MAG: hypothetical protein CVU39_25525 [Chloroflexi bacterium HGW-Chloroflexi-10]|nr:MAG: hypothetical protein CVU39_25525 [Chloroflexi bacterium HGW-Chloroflexi-10]
MFQGGKMIKKSLILFLMATMLLTACSAKSATQESYNLEVAPAAAPEMEMRDSYEMDGGNANYGYEETTVENGVSGVEPVRIVIRNADLSIVVTEPGDAMQSIAQMAERMGGFVVTSNLWKTKNYSDVEVPEANITVRVPADLLNQALDEIKALTNDRELDVLSENVSGQDVTKEYTDLNSRLKNLEDAEAKLSVILEEATRTEDVLATFEQLTYYREQIEITKGQIKYYEESAALSAISVRIQAHEAVNPITVAGWKPSVEVSKALQALVNAMQDLFKGLIWLIIVILPVLIVIFLPFYLAFLVIRAIVRNSKKRKVQKQSPEK